MQDIFRRVLSQKNEVDKLEDQVKSRQTAVDSINKDQARIRENMKALKGTAEEKALLQRYTGELNSQEDRLAALRRELEDLRAKRNIAGAELDRIVMGITLDESF
jgi:predicted  nucleic acid-binding Zn-ribbon protein